MKVYAQLQGGISPSLVCVLIHIHTCHRYTTLCEVLTCIITGADWGSTGNGSSLLFGSDTTTMPSFTDGLCDSTMLLVE